MSMLMRLAQLTCPIAIPTKIAVPFALFVIHSEANRLFVALRTKLSQHGPKIFWVLISISFVALSKKVRANKETVFVGLQFETAPVDDQLGTRIDTGLQQSFSIEHGCRRQTGPPRKHIYAALHPPRLKPSLRSSM